MFTILFLSELTDYPNLMSNGSDVERVLRFVRKEFSFCRKKGRLYYWYSSKTPLTLRHKKILNDTQWRRNIEDLVSLFFVS